MKSNHLTVVVSVVTLAVLVIHQLEIQPLKAKIRRVEAQTTNAVWFGHPVISDNDRYNPRPAWLPGYQIGFRSDGVVVWKTVP